MKEHINEFREVFAQAFSYYYEPSYRPVLKAYAPEMFRYMDDMSKKGFNEINTQVKEKQTTPLDFKSDIDAAKEFGAKIKLSDTVVTKEDKKFMDGYVAYGPMLNRILRGVDKHPGISDIDMFIHGIDSLFKKKKQSFLMILLYIEELMKGNSLFQLGLYSPRMEMLIMMQLIS
ncbi:anthrax toxin lethal factor-related metalloendopeptidase [Brevibacillus laterosporus]